MNRKTLIALLAGTALMGMANSAFALDGNDVLAKLNAAMATGGGTLKATVATDGATVTLSGATLEVAGAPSGIPLGDVTMQGVKEDKGGYKVEKISFADINFTEKDMAVTTSEIFISGAHIPASTTTGTLDGMFLYDSFHAGPMTVSAKGVKVVAIDEMNGNVVIADDKSKMEFDMGITGIHVDLSSVPDPKAIDAIDKLGLRQINGEVTMKANWTLADGRMELTEYAYDFENIGRLDIKLAVSGYTLEFIKSLQEAMKSAQTNPDKAAAQQAMGMVMMGMMQQLSYHGASIRFDDAGITRKALDYAGAQQGVDGAQMAQSLKGMLPLMIGQLNMPDLQAQITTAVNAFLDNPKSIEVSATPAQPLPLPQIMGAAMGAPQTLPQVLGVKITANE